MGATLRYAKVVDRDHVQAHGGLTPATDNLVTLPEDAPAVARDFLVLRAWDVDSGGFEETWRLEDVNGHVVYRGTPRTVLAEHGEVFDEVQGVRFEYADDAYNLVLEVDGREVARTDFAVTVTADGGAAVDTSVPTAPGEGDDGADADRRVRAPADLSDQERAVLTAVAELEARDGPGHVHDVARAAELDVDAVRSSLSRLTGPHDLVQEVGPAGETADQGPRYRVKARP